MALGPKEMGEAIIANLKNKTGKDKNEWLKEIVKSGLSEKKELKDFLKRQGLGVFQANAIVEVHFNDCSYDNPNKIVNDLFIKYPEQKTMMNSIIKAIKTPFSLTVRPCKGYIPLYGEDNKISLSFKPTVKGLYIGLIGDSFPFETVPHKKSYGGSSRMNFGMFANTKESSIQDLKTYLSQLS